MKHSWLQEVMYSPVFKMNTLWTLFALTASIDLELLEMDVNSVFLHGNIEEELYIKKACFCNSLQGTVSVQSREASIWAETSLETVVQKGLYLYAFVWG